MISVTVFIVVFYIMNHDFVKVLTIILKKKKENLTFSKVYPNTWWKHLLTKDCQYEILLAINIFSFI